MHLVEGVPVMINGLQYGEKNIWKANTPGSIAQNETGPVSAENMKWLDQKSSTGYGLQNSIDVGKTILGYNSSKNVWTIVSQQNGVEGMSMDMIKSSLIKAGFDNIMSFDGSSSSTLIKDQTILTKPADYKNTYCACWSTIKCAAIKIIKMRSFIVLSLILVSCNNHEKSDNAKIQIEKLEKKSSINSSYFLINKFPKINECNFSESTKQRINDYLENVNELNSIKDSSAFNVNDNSQRNNRRLRNFS